MSLGLDKGAFRCDVIKHHIRRKQTTTKSERPLQYKQQEEGDRQRVKSVSQRRRQYVSKPLR